MATTVFIAKKLALAQHATYNYKLRGIITLDSFISNSYFIDDRAGSYQYCYEHQAYYDGDTRRFIRAFSSDDS